MKTNFNIGDKVSFINEKGGGIIAHILNNYRVLVTNDDGFDVSVSINEIVPVSEKSDYKVDTRMINAKEEREITMPKLAKDEIWEVDLHLQEILDTGREMTDHEKLLTQLRYFNRCIDVAKAHGIKKMIFIHGVGKGTLKQEIIYELKKLERIRYYDASFKKYGFGAITVELL